VVEALQLSAMPLWVLLVFAAAWGAVWGSFATVIIWRYPRDESIVTPGSRCPACLTPLRWHDNIPIAGFLLVGGRCRACGQKIPVMYPAVETIAVLLAMIALFLLYDPRGELLPFLTGFFIHFTFFWALLVIAIVDLRSFLVPDILTLPGIVLFLSYNFIVAREQTLTIGLSVIGAYVLVGLVFNRLYRLLSGVEGMGMGDAKLLAMVAALTGWKGGLFALIAGAAQGLLVNTPILLLRRRRGEQASPEGDGKAARSFMRTEVPFGPMLAIGAFEYVLWGDSIIRVYLALADRIAWLINVSGR